MSQPGADPGTFFLGGGTGVFPVAYPALVAFLFRDGQTGGRSVRPPQTDRRLSLPDESRPVS